MEKYGFAYWVLDIGRPSGYRVSDIGRPSGYRVSDIGYGLWARGESSIKNRSSGRFFLHMSKRLTTFAAENSLE